MYRERNRSFASDDTASLNESNQFSEDMKKARKLRKKLRQIEHLLLLARPLNKEETKKVVERDTYRQQFALLNSIYKNGELYENESFNNSTTSPVNAQLETSDQQNQNQYYSFQDVEEEGEGEEEDQEEEKQAEIEEEPIIEIERDEEKKEDNKLEQMYSKKEQIQINIEKEENKSQKQNKKVLKKSLLKPTFETNGNMENIHDDLILSIDICEKSNLIVTGR
jgi:hypothetical protein